MNELQQKTSDSSIAVHCEGVNKVFGDGAQALQVLHDVSVEFAAGELSLLVGPSGCGKTTLISIIGGILSSTSGEVSVFGRRVDQLRGRALSDFRLNNISFIFQQYNLLPTLTAAENASVALAAKGLRKKAALAIARDVLVQLGLESHLDKYPNQLSGGQQQRVAIARALAPKPKLIVCDEPTAALDAAAGLRVMELITEIAVGPDRACIVVTHDNRIFHFAHRIIEMEDGRVHPRVEGVVSAH